MEEGTTYSFAEIFDLFLYRQILWEIGESENQQMSIDCIKKRFGEFGYENVRDMLQTEVLSLSGTTVGAGQYFYEECKEVFSNPKEAVVFEECEEW